MGSLNCCTFIGHIGRDAEARYINGGTAVTKFSLACSETWTDRSGQRQERTEWIGCELWGKQAEALTPYLVKGKQVYVQGALRFEEYTDKEGVKRKSHAIRIDRLVLLGGGGRGDGDRAPARPAARMSNEEAQRGTSVDPTWFGAGAATSDTSDLSGMLTDDDIPF